jgi:uncharacterized membrane protein YgaE (UPF0421/DUF939 family)
MNDDLTSEQSHEEAVALLRHYRLRHHQLTDNSAFQGRLIASLRQEVDASRRAVEKVPQLEARVKELEAENQSLRSFKASVDEALNSGDGSYRP